MKLKINLFVFIIFYETYAVFLVILHETINDNNDK